MKLGLRILFVIPLLLLVILCIYPLFLRSGPSIRFDTNHCRLVRESSSEVVIECSKSVLYTSDGLYIQLLPERDGPNSVRLELAYSFNYNDEAILLTVFRSDNPRIEVALSPNRDYAGKYVIGWTLNLVVYEYVNGDFVFGDAKSIELKGDYPSSGWVIRLSQNQYVVNLQLYPITGSPPQEPQRPSWAPANDWFKTFNDLLNAVGQGLQAGVSIFISALSFLLNILQYLPLIIPLHIIAAFIDSPERGVSAINFYVSLGRRLIDLVVKIVHAIISLLDAVTPFT